MNASLTTPALLPTTPAPEEGYSQVVKVQLKLREMILAGELAAGSRPMLFGDFSYYWIADREYRSFKRLNELYAANGQIGFLASQRVDGMLMLKEAVKALEMKAKG